MIQVLNDIMLALVLRRLHRRRFNVVKAEQMTDTYTSCVLDAGGYRIETLVNREGTVRICGPNNEALSEAFDPYNNRADSLWLAQTIKDRRKEQADEESYRL